jgi:hypothetical protein
VLGDTVPLLFYKTNVYFTFLTKQLYRSCVMILIKFYYIFCLPVYPSSGRNTDSQKSEKRRDLSLQKQTSYLSPNKPTVCTVIPLPFLLFLQISIST